LIYPERLLKKCRFNAWLPTVVFLQTQGPRWEKGFPTLFGALAIACCCFGECIPRRGCLNVVDNVSVVIWWFAKRQKAQEQQEHDIEERERAVGIVATDYEEKA
jgi:hypothetical protein